uniref:LITAF domain-containing protein n=1 Tax=Trichobilharzia regenti TaxID=157069 RepID=A0AA85JEG9_TRIRE|nr:unnamed protein product [Trichobilharzia regenti]
MLVSNGLCKFKRPEKIKGFQHRTSAPGLSITPENTSVLKDTALSSEKRRYSVQNAAGPGGPIGEKKSSSQRVSPRTTPYLNAPTATTGLTPPGNHLPRASIACIPLSIQAQIQQGQLVKADQPQPTLGKGTSVPPTTPRISISKSPELDGDNAKKLGRLPKSFRCECCQQVTVTRTTYQIGALTWLMAALIFICGGVLGCFLIPFFVDCCKDVKHVCPFCGTEIGLVKCI